MSEVHGWWKFYHMLDGSFHSSSIQPTWLRKLNCQPAPTFYHRPGLGKIGNCLSPAVAKIPNKGKNQRKRNKEKVARARFLNYLLTQIEKKLFWIRSGNQYINLLYQKTPDRDFQHYFETNKHPKPPLFFVKLWLNVLAPRKGISYGL